MVQTIYLGPPFSLPSQPRPPRKCLTTEVEHLEENQNTSASRSSRSRSSKVGKHRILVLWPKLTVRLAELGIHIKHLFHHLQSIHTPTAATVV